MAVLGMSACGVGLRRRGVVRNFGGPQLIPQQSCRTLPKCGESRDYNTYRPNDTGDQRDAQRTTFGLRTPTIAIRVSGRTPLTLARELAERGICCWNSNFYAPNLSERLGVEETGGFLRIGLVHYNTLDEAEELLQALRAATGSIEPAMSL